jgi:hypothetical protein
VSEYPGPEPDGEVVSLSRRCPPLELSPEEQARYYTDLVEQAAARRGLSPEPWPCTDSDGVS